MACSKILFYSAIYFLNSHLLFAQAPPKKKTVTNVVGYQQYQQKQWEKNQLPKNSVQYKTDIKYKAPEENKNSIPNLHLPQKPVPAVKKSFSDSATQTYKPGLKIVIPDTASNHYKWKKTKPATMLSGHK